MYVMYYYQVTHVCHVLCAFVELLLYDYLILKKLLFKKYKKNQSDIFVLVIYMYVIQVDGVSCAPLFRCVTGFEYLVLFPF